MTKTFWCLLSENRFTNFREKFAYIVMES